MINIRLIYEQIETSKTHLLSGSLLGFRLALILLDNVAELLMQRELDYVFSMNDQMQPKWEPARSEWMLGKDGPKYTSTERQDAEREFEPKTRILCFRLGRISSDDRSVLTVCHKFRCEAFHRGKLRQSILEQVSKLLYITVVNLTLNLPIRSFILPRTPPSQEDASFLARFGFKNVPLFDPNGRMQMAEQLLANIDFDKAAFATVLSSDLIERIDETIGGLEYLGETSDHSKIDRNLQYRQFWQNLGAKLFKEGVRDRDLEKAYLKWQAEGQPKYTLYKIKKWRQQADSMRRHIAPVHVLVQYWAIDRRLRPFEDDVSEAVFRYDEEINSRI